MEGQNLIFKPIVGKNILDSKNGLEKRVRQGLIKKYEASQTNYHSLLAHSIVYNEKCHIVAVFKESLIFEENEEFLNG
jgi:hypothetical protein